MDHTYVNHVHMDRTMNALPYFYKQYATSNNNIRAAIAPSNLTSIVKVNEKYDTGSYVPVTKSYNPIKEKETDRFDSHYEAVERRRVKPVIPGLITQSSYKSQSKVRPPFVSLSKNKSSEHKFTDST